MNSLCDEINQFLSFPSSASSEDQPVVVVVAAAAVELDVLLLKLNYFLQIWGSVFGVVCINLFLLRGIISLFGHSFT